MLRFSKGLRCAVAAAAVMLASAVFAQRWIDAATGKPVDSRPIAGAVEVSGRIAEQTTTDEHSSALPAQSLPRWAQDMLAAHNAARAAIGAPPLQWNVILQEHATTRAGELARLRQLVHAPRGGRGTERENLL